MKILAALLLLAAGLAHAGEWYAGTSTHVPQWKECGTLGVNPVEPKRPSVVFLNSSLPQYTPPAGQWHTVDATRWGIPADACAVDLRGLLIITHGSVNQICDLTLALRAPGSDLPASSYVGQTLEASVNGGQRSNMASWVPLVEGRFEWQWNRNTTGQWPEDCAYGVNLTIQAYLR